MEITFRTPREDEVAAPGELHVRPTAKHQSDAAALARLVLEHGREALVQGEGPPRTVVVKDSPTFDDMLAVLFVQELPADWPLQKNGKELGGAHSLAEAAASLRQGVRPWPDTPLTDTLDGVFATMRHQRRGPQGSGERAKIPFGLGKDRQGPAAGAVRSRRARLGEAAAPGRVRPRAPSSTRMRRSIRTTWPGENAGESVCPTSLFRRRRCCCVNHGVRTSTSRRVPTRKRESEDIASWLSAGAKASGISRSIPATASRSTAWPTSCRTPRNGATPTPTPIPGTTGPATSGPSFRPRGKAASCPMRRCCGSSASGAERPGGRPAGWSSRWRCPWSSSR